MSPKRHCLVHILNVFFFVVVACLFLNAMNGVLSSPKITLKCNIKCNISVYNILTFLMQSHLQISQLDEKSTAKCEKL